MGKTTYVDGNPAEGVPGTIVTADFLNKVNNHYHTGRDIDGEGALAYAADNGEADAYVVALSPVLDEYITGMPITFKATYANTGASTVNVNELGAVAIKKNGSEDLAAGDILAGQIVTIVYDGTQFQLTSAIKFNEAQLRLSVRDATRGLVVKNNATYPTHQVDFSADEIILQDSSGSLFRITSMNTTIDIWASGNGGLDMGSVANSTWYHIWAIAKSDGTKSAIFSLSATAPTLPSGYTYKAYLGAWYVGSDGNFRVAYQRGNRVAWKGLYTDVSMGTQTSFTAFAISVPPTARIWYGDLAVYASADMGCVDIAADADATSYAALVGYDKSGATAPQAGFSCIIKTPQTLYYHLQAAAPYATTACNIHTGGWEY